MPVNPYYTLPALFALVPWARAQDASGPDTASRDAGHSIERYRDYLLKKPYHDWSFDKLVEAAVAQNQLKELVASYEKTVKDEPENRAARVVLARMYAKGDRVADALKLLKEIAPSEAPLSKLIGELYLKNNDPKSAVAELEKALVKTDDIKFLQEVHRQRGKAYLATGDRTGAAAAIRAIAQTDPASFNTRLDVASTLAQSGLNEEATAEFQEADRLAGTDNSKRCRVLAELGRVQEQQLKMNDALATYRQALALMGRGNWLKSDIQGRILLIHKRANSFDKLIEDAKNDILQKPQDADAREFLARAFEDANKLDDARVALAKAVADFPDDLRLSRRMLGVLGKLKSKDDLIAEYQRVLSRHPEEIDFYIELGRIFADDKRLEQARVQWEKLFQQKLKDTDTCVRLAALYAFYGMEREAMAMHEKAIELQPREMRHYADYATYLLQHNKTKELDALLEKATEISKGNASMLEQVAQAWRETNNKKRALEVLQSAVALLPSDARLLSTLADLQFENGDEEGSSATLHRVIDLSDDSNARGAAVDRCIRTARKSKQLEKLLAKENAAVESGAKERAPYLILGKFFTQERKFAEAQAIFQKMLEFDPASDDARRQLARLYEDQGEFEIAIQQYQSLVDKQPAARRKYLKEMARIYIALYDQDKAFSLYDEILKSSPDNAAAFKEVSDAYLRLNYLDKAAECLQQAIRLKPDDGRYHLALAAIFRRQNEVNKSEGEIALATQSKDEEVIADARKKLYQQWSETGQLEEKIQTLRKKTDENPYDIDSPVLLADIYIKELEYQLAVDMLDKLLNYQPEEPRLLETRARILSLLDRHDDAIRDYEKLLKLPKVDRDQIVMKIAGAAMDTGDTTRASEVTSGIRALDKVAELYKKHDLVEPAVAAMEKAVSQSPNNIKYQIRLSRLYNQSGQREKAAQTLERALGLAGDDWDILVALATIYSELGKKDEAVEYGKRLLAATRSDTNDRDSQTPAQSTRYTSYRDEWDYTDYNAAMTAQAIDSIRAFFEEHGYAAEFGDVIADEVKLQPRSAVLYQQAVSFFRSQKNAQLSLDTTTFVRAETIGKNKIPKGYSRNEWEALIARNWRDANRMDLKTSEKRAFTLQELLEKPGADATEFDCMELADLLDLQRKEADAKEIIKNGIIRFPNSARLPAALAARFERDKHYDEAVQNYEKSLALLPEPGSEKLAAEKIDNAFRKQKRYLLDRFPQTVRRRVNEEHLRKIYETEYVRIDEVDTNPGGRVTPVGIGIAIARCLARGGRRDDARGALAKIQIGGDLRCMISVAAVFFDNEMYEDAEKYYLQMSERAIALDSDPILGYVKPAFYLINDGMSKLARIYEKRKKFYEAYDSLRTWGDPNAAELLATSNNIFPVLAAEYTKKFEAAAAALPASPRPEQCFDFRDAGVKFAECLQFQKKYEDALKIYRLILQQLPDDFSIHKVIAELLERSGKYDDSLAEYYASVKRKRELNRSPVRDDPPKRHEIAPLSPPRASKSSDEWIWSNLQYARGSAGGPRFPVSSDYAAIIRNLLDRKQLSKAADALRDLAREDMGTFRWLAWELGEIVDRYNFGPVGLPVLKLLYSYEPNEYSIWRSYAKSLIAADQADEAVKILNLQHSRAGNAWAEREIQDLMTAADAKIGNSKKETVESLKLAVEKDPKNIKLKTRLAKKFSAEKKFTEALAVARAAEALAPHLEEVKSLLRNCLRSAGEFDGLKVQLQKEIAQGSDTDETLSNAFELANIYFSEGDTKKADDVLTEVSRRVPATRQRSSIAAWYASKRMDARAVETIDREVNDIGKGQYQFARMTAQQIQFKLVSGDLPGALDSAWKRIERSASLGEKQTTFESFANLLRNIPNFDIKKNQVLEIARNYVGPRGNLYRAAAMIASGDWNEADAELAAAFAQDPKFLYVFPIRISLARAANDWTRALELVGELEKQNAGSEGASIYTVAGNMTERDTLRSEKAQLLLKLGKRDEALKVYMEIADVNRPENRLILANIYSTNELYDEAVEMLKSYLDRVGERNFAHLQLLARLYLKKNKYDLAIEAVRRGQILNKESDNRINWDMGTVNLGLFEIYLRANRMPEYLKDLREKLAADPDNSETLKELARVASFLSERDAAIAALEKIAERPGAGMDIYRSIANHYARAGSLDKAIGSLEKSIDQCTNEWERRSLSSQIASWYLESKNLEKGLEFLKRGQESAESADGNFRVASELARKGYYENAIELFLKTRSIDPNYPIMDRSLFDCYKQTGKTREALDAAFRVLKDPMAPNAYFKFYERFAGFAESAGEEARVAATLAASPGDPALLHESAFLALFGKRFDDAILKFSELKSKLPGDVSPQCGLAVSLHLAGQFQRAFEEYQILYRLLARSPDAAMRRWDTMELYRQAGNLALRLKGPQAALEAWRDPFLRSPERVESGSFNYYSTSYSRAEEAMNLYNHGYYKESAAELEDFMLRKTRRDWQTIEEHARAIYGTGDRDRAAAELWWEILKPLDEFADEFGSQNREYDYPWQNRWGFLLEMALENGTLPSLEARVLKERAAHPEIVTLKTLHKRILVEKEDFASLAATYLKELEQKPEDLEALSELAGCYLKLNRASEALPVARSFASLSRANLQQSEVVTSRSGRNSANRFRFAGTGGNSGGGSSYSSGSGDDSSIGASAQLAAVYRKLGNAAEADKYESEALVQRLPGTYGYRSDVFTILAQKYEQANLYDDAERCYELAIAKFSEPAGLSDEYLDNVRLSIFESLITMQLRAKNREKYAAAADRYIKLLTKEIDAERYDSNLRLRRAETIVARRGDLALAQKDAEFCLKELPDSAQARLVLGWVAFRKGDNSGALAFFKQSEELSNAEGVPPSADLLYGRGLALAAESKLDEARPMLRRALAKSAVHPAAEEARKLLN
ncbi:MAG: tetratricopeptide repeat protein [Planctomycetes bacterium]|nr:tetratricopeptide repeat protein [Planctomycetota bacterium]